MTCRDKACSKSFEVPCEVGKSVWITLYTKKRLEALEYEINSITISHIGSCVENNDNTTIVVCRGEHKMSFQMGLFQSCLGKTIFFSKEEAEQALKEHIADVGKKEREEEC